MSKKKLCTLLSTFLRRSLTSIPEHSPLKFSTQIKLSVHLSPSSPFAPYARLCHNPTCSYSIGYLRFSGKILCSKYAEKLESSRCWTCHAVPESAPFLVCESCGCIQPVDDSVTISKYLAYKEKKYDIEGKNLEGKYKEWQKKLHPDLVHSKSQQERDFAAEQSARVIDAYRTLSKLSRGIYMLKLGGVEVDEEQTISDPELLAEILEIREGVEEATNSEAVNHILSQMQNWSNAFANAFQSQNFEEAKISIQRMTYYNRVIDEVIKKL